MTLTMSYTVVFPITGSKWKADNEDDRLQQTFVASSPQVFRKDL